MKQIRRTRSRTGSTTDQVRSLVRRFEHLQKIAEQKTAEQKTAEQKTAEQKTAENLTYQQFYDQAPIGFYTLDGQGRITAVNERGSKLLGFPPAWLIGRAFVVFVSRPHVQHFLDCLTEAARDPLPRSIHLNLSEANRVHPVQIAIETSKVDSKVLHRLTVVDVTDLQKTEQLLRESLANWYSLVHNASNTIMTVESSGRILFVNRPAWGYSVSALTGTNIVDHLPEAERQKVIDCLDQSFRFKLSSTCEVSGINGERTAWYRFNFGSTQAMNLYRDLPEPEATTTVLIHEISDVKRTEQNLRASREQMRDFAARLEAVREDERSRVAREIHDDLGQALTVLKLDLSWIRAKRFSPAALKRRLGSIIKQVDETIDRVRRISSELRPSVLDNLGLIPAIEWQIQEIRKRSGTRIRLKSNIDGLDLPMELSVVVFRVVQEALTNVVRHAKASKVEVTLNIVKKVLCVSVIDNGVGISKNNRADLKSLGIVGMKERISRIGGAFSISSEPGKGTRLDITIPVAHD